MSLSAVLASLDLLDSAHVTGHVVADAFRAAGLDAVEVTKLTGPRGTTDAVRVVVPGTGLHINNIMGEGDLSPYGFHRHPPGRRMPSMMAPSVVLRDDVVELVLGSAGSSRIRSAILQTIVAVVDRGMQIEHAVCAPRVHFEDDIVYAEPGIDVEPLREAGRKVVRFRAPNLFFGGVQGVQRLAGSGVLLGGGDPRRGGVAVSA